MKKSISFFLVAVMIFSFIAVAVYSESEKTVASAPASIGENDIFVSVDGDDSAAGTIDAPLATFAAAKEKVKHISGEEQINVWFRGGRYEISEIIRFDDTDRRNVSYRAYDNETVEIFAGKYVTGWETTEINGITAWVADVSDDPDFYTLYNNERHLQVSRYPEEDYLFAADGPSSVGVGASQPWSAFGNPEDLIDFYSLESVLVHIIARGWTEDVMHIRSLDVSTGEIEFDYGTLFGLERNERYWFTNVREALNEPGEWYLDRTEKKVYYIPQEGETFESAEIYRGCLNYIVRADNLSDVSFVGLTFMGTDFDYENACGPFAPSQVNHAALFFKNCSNITVDSCVVRNVGATAIGLHMACSDCSVINSHICQTGVSGIAASDNNWDSECTFSNNLTIENNLVESFGRYNGYAIGICVNETYNTVIKNNTVHDGYYDGILANDEANGAGNYFADPDVGSSVKILNNYVYDIGQNTLSDLGGIYSYGYHTSVEIKNNVVHDCTCYSGPGGYQGCCLYIDTPSSHVDIEQNLFFNASSRVVSMAFITKNTIFRNNICAFSETIFGCGSDNSALFWKEEDLLVDHNVLCSDNADSDLIYDGGFEVNNPVAITESDNLFFDYTKTYKDQSFHKNEYYDENPLFKDPFKGDFSLLENSPLFDIDGFVVWDIYDVGCHNSFRDTDVLAQINDPLYRFSY